MCSYYLFLEPLSFRNYLNVMNVEIALYLFRKCVIVNNSVKL